MYLFRVYRPGLLVKRVNTGLSCVVQYYQIKIQSRKIKKNESKQLQRKKITKY